VTEEYRQACERYFDGEIAADERRRLEARLAADPDAQRYLAALRRVRTLMETYDPAAELPPARPVVIASRRRVAPATIWWSGAVAAAVLVAVLWVTFVRRPTSPPAPQPGSTPLAADPIAEPVARPRRPGDAGLEPAVLAWSNGQAPQPTDFVIALRREQRRGDAPDSAELLALESANGGASLVAALGHVVAEQAGVGRFGRHRRRSADSSANRAGSRPGRGDDS
jgi:hypothetical protein